MTMTRTKTRMGIQYYDPRDVTPGDWVQVEWTDAVVSVGMLQDGMWYRGAHGDPMMRPTDVEPFGWHPIASGQVSQYRRIAVSDPESESWRV